MVGLVIEAPLTDDQVSPGILHPLDHVSELLFFVLPQLLVLFHRCDVELVLCLGAWGLEGACQDGEAGVFHGVGHLRMRHIFVDEYTLDECGISERAADFAIDLDQVEGDVLAVEVSNLQNSVYSNLCKLLVLFRHTAFDLLICACQRKKERIRTFYFQDWSLQS